MYASPKFCQHQVHVTVHTAGGMKTLKIAQWGENNELFPVLFFKDYNRDVVASICSKEM